MWLIKNLKSKISRKCLSFFKENEDEEQNQIKKDHAKEKVKVELKLMEVRYKRQQNKITSADTGRNC